MQDAKIFFLRSCAKSTPTVGAKVSVCDVSQMDGRKKGKKEKKVEKKWGGGYVGSIHQTKCEQGKKSGYKRPGTRKRKKKG